MADRALKNKFPIRETCVKFRVIYLQTKATGTGTRRIQ